MKTIEKLSKIRIGNGELEYRVKFVEDAITATETFFPKGAPPKINAGQRIVFRCPSKRTQQVQIRQENWNSGIPSGGHRSGDRWSGPEGSIEYDEAAKLLAELREDFEQARDLRDDVMKLFLRIEREYLKAWGPLGPELNPRA